MSPVKGDSPLVVLIHGFCENHEIWDMLVSDLEPDWETIAIDIPGFGGTQIPGRTGSLDEVARVIFDELPRHDNLVLVGHSLGGYISMEILRSQSRAISGVIMFHSTSFADAPVKKENRNKTIDFIRKNGKGPFLKQFVPLLFSPGNLGKQYGNIEKLSRIATLTPTETILTYTAWMRDRRDNSGLVEKTEVPFLYISGMDDAFISPDLTKRESALSGKTQLAVLEHTGHLGMMEAPGKTYELVHHFLRSV